MQLNKTSSAHCIVHPLPKAKPLSVPTVPINLPFAHLHLPLAIITLSVSMCLYVCVCECVCVFNPFTFFHPGPQFPSPLTAVSLFYVSMSLFCSSFYFVHHISHRNEITWYFSFLDCLISFSIIISRPIYVVAKDRISFLFMAE